MSANNASPACETPATPPAITAAPSWWQRLIPRYGNWGGPGWCGGSWQSDPLLTDWAVRPIDAIDAAYKAHDRAYQVGPITRGDADRRLVFVLGHTDARGWYATAHRLGAMLIFSITGAIRK